MNVEKLRQNNYLVRVTHYRDYESDIGIERLPKYQARDLAYDYTQPLPTGGYTMVEITDPDGTTVIGEAECSVKENFCRKLGLRIALSRAMFELDQIKKQEVSDESNR